MEIQLSVASTDLYVESLPKGAKVTSYEIRNNPSNRMLDKGKAGTLKQVLKRLDFVAALGMTVDVIVIADHDGATIKTKDAYILKSKGPVKV